MLEYQPELHCRSPVVTEREPGGEVNQEESEHNEVDGMKKGLDSTGEVMHI